MLDLPPALARNPSLVHQALLKVEAEIYERSLYEFLKAAWSSFDSSPFVGGWHLEAIAEHLEAVTAGQIRKLLVNVRPRAGKTGILSIAWPCWVWAKRSIPGNVMVGPGARFLCASYGANKAQEDGVTARRLIASNWYQDHWGDRFTIRADRDNQGQFDTSAGGSRINTGIPESLGKGGIYRVIDDPTKPDEVESSAQMEKVIRSYREVWATRGNDPQSGAEVMIMQRQAENDLSGYWLEQYGRDVVHLCIPAWYEPDRHCVTYVNGFQFWEDPRSVEGESFWPERYPPGQRKVDERLGAFGFSGQIQQRPEPRGGSIIDADYWQRWPPEGEEASWMREVQMEDGHKVMRPLFPEFDLKIAWLDGAYTKDDANDFSALVVFGTFTHGGRPGIMLKAAWRKRVEFHDLVWSVIETCRAHGVDRLLIENKASGLSAAQEIRRLVREEEFTIETVNPKGDKTARLIGVQPLFAGGVVYAPWREPDGYRWVRMVVDEVHSFPRAAHDDLTDCVSGALGWLRRTGVAQLASEKEHEDYEALLFRPYRRTVAASYGVGR